MVVKAAQKAFLRKGLIPASRRGGGVLFRRITVYHIGNTREFKKMELEKLENFQTVFVRISTPVAKTYLVESDGASTWK